MAKVRNMFWGVLGLACLLVPCVAGARGDGDEATKPGTVEALPIDRQVGQRLGDFTLKDAISGRSHRLYGFGGKKAAVLVFLGTECPLARLYAPRLAELHRRYGAKGVVFLGIYSNAHEGEEAIAAQAREAGIEFPLLRDEKNVVADQALVERTPEVLVLDGKARVRYRGAIDDQYQAGTRRDQPSHRYLEEALDAVLESRPVATSATPVHGCLLDRIEPQQAARSRPRVRPAPPELAAARGGVDDEPVIDPAQATYAASAARIIQDRCQSCHRPGQVGPFSLLTYDDARKHAAMIREVVDNRRMPPWHADPRHGRFSNDRSLTPRERATLLAWVDRGTPLGDAAKLPPPRSFPEGWTIGKPDVVFELPESYVVPAQGVVDYVRLRVPTGFTEDRWIQAAEAQPGDRSVVHHIVVYVIDAKGKDRRDGPAHLCAYAPGDLPSVYAPGTAKRVPAGAELLFEMHYTPNGAVRHDRSRVGFIFSKVPVTRRALTVPVVNEHFVIPPRQDDVAVSASLTLAQDTRLLSFLPHMHLRGEDFRYSIARPGQPAEVVLSVPAYDFGWQSYYVLEEPLDLPAGTRVDCLAHYDNSERNPYNPDPDRAVRWGEQTFEEMMIGYMDVDLPVETPFRLAPEPGAGGSPPAREAPKDAGARPGAVVPAPGADRRGPRASAR
jgi:peroxiredoxin